MWSNTNTSTIIFKLIVIYSNGIKFMTINLNTWTRSFESVVSNG